MEVLAETVKEDAHSWGDYVEDVGRRKRTKRERKKYKARSLYKEANTNMKSSFPSLESEDPSESSSAVVCASKFHVLEVWSKCISTERWRVFKK